MNISVLPEHVDECRNAPGSEDGVQPLVVVRQAVQDAGHAANRFHVA